jgi:hypothetical protein
MTTIAFDGRFLAADGLQQREGITIERRAVKLVLGALGVYAMTGQCGWCPAWVDWAEAGAKVGECPPADTSTESLLIRARWTYSGEGDVDAWPAEMLSNRMPYWAAEASPSAWGSGREHAITAMDLGQNAMVAVHMASLRDTSTGGRIMFVDTWAPETERKLQEWTGELNPQIRSQIAECLGGPCDSNAAEPIDEAAGYETAMNGAMLREALNPEWVHITKPQKRWISAGHWDDGKMEWMPECSGRLVLNTGCGHCLRCNREWHVLLRQPHERMADGVIRVHRSEVASQTTAAPLASAEPKTARAVLEDWVSEMNAALKGGDSRKVATLNTALMSMTLPAGVIIQLDPPGSDQKHWRRRLVDAAKAIT